MRDHGVTRRDAVRRDATRRERMTELSEEESQQPSRQPAVQMLLFIVAERQLDLSCEPAISTCEIVA